MKYPCIRLAGRFVLLTLLLLTSTKNLLAIKCSGCKNPQMVFNEDYWHCEQCHHIHGAYHVIQHALGASNIQPLPEILNSPLMTDTGMSCPPPPGLPQNTNQTSILSTQHLCDIAIILESVMQNFPDPGGVTVQSVHSASVLAQLQLLQLTQSIQRDLTDEEQTLNLIYLVSLWILQARGYKHMAKTILSQIKIEKPFLIRQFSQLSKVLASFESIPALGSLFGTGGASAPQDGTQQALSRLQRMTSGQYEIYQVEKEKKLIIIYYLEGVYHIITPLNKVFRTTSVEGAVRILQDFMQYLRPNHNAYTALIGAKKSFKMITLFTMIYLAFSSRAYASRE